MRAPDERPTGGREVRGSHLLEWLCGYTHIHLALLASSSISLVHIFFILSSFLGLSSCRPPPPFHFLKLPPETGNGTNKRRGDGGVGVRPIGASFKRAVRGVPVSPENACARASTTGGRGVSQPTATHTPLDTTHALPITIFRCYRLTPPPPPPTPPTPNGVYKRKMRETLGSANVVQLKRLY